MKKSYQLLMPQYMHQFQCTGSACEDTCCAGWNITIEKEAYKKYQKIQDKELKEEIKKNVKRVKKNANEYNYAVMQLDESGNCGFLTKDKLCGLQVKLGEEALCQTCAVYPKVYNNVDQKIEISSKLSCPETARLALLNPDPMEFDIIEREYGKDILFMNDVSSTSRDSFYSYFWDIRVFVISLLQNRSYDLKHRLFLLGLFCSKLEEIKVAGNLEAIPTIITQFKKQIEERYFNNLLNLQTDAVHVSIKLVKEMTQIRSQHNMFNARYRKVVEDTFAGLKLTDGTEDEITSVYQETLSSIYEPFIEEHGYIIENYLVNHVFESLFVYSSDGKSIMQQYIKLVSLYSMIKFHMIGVGGYDGRLTPQKTLEIIQSFSRSTEHSRTYLDWLVQSVEKTGMNSMALMAIIIMN